MTRLFALAGVDYVQWKAVSRTLLRADFRAPTPQTSASYSLRSIVGLLRMALVFGVFGAAAAVLVVINADVLLTGTITLVYLTFALATALLTQHGATMLAAADHSILGPRPVTARTFFAIRLTNVLFHALLMTTFIAYPPVIAFTFAHGISIARGLAAAAAIYGWAIAITLVVVTSYAALLRWVGAGRLQRAVAYVQLAAGIAAYAGYFFAMETFGRAALRSATMPDGAWVSLLPPVWFASYIEIAAAQGGPASWAPAVLTLVLLAGLAVLLRGRLTADYADRLSQPVVDISPRSAASERSPLFFARDEPRAVALLTAAHFRYDLRIRMGLFGLIPLLLVYVVAGLREGGNPDPFIGATSDRGANFLAMAALMFPAIITRHLESSDGYQASWIYTVTTADAGRLVVALKNVATVYFLVPFAVILAALFAWRFGNALHAITHAGLLAGISHLALQIAVLLSPRLPFAQPPDKTRGTAMFAWLIGVLVGGQLVLVAIQRFVYPSMTRIAAAVIAIVVASWLLEYAIRRRARR
jgi:hypothetical protein